MDDCIPRNQEKFLRYTSHEEFIRKCIRDTIAPKGFMLKWNIQMGASSELEGKCERIKLDASLKLMGVVAGICRNKLEELGKTFMM